MIKQLKVLQCERTGIPFLKIPGEAMWDLLEFLSWHQVQAEYEYYETYFSVFFLFQDLETAQNLIDGWLQSHPVATPAPVEQRAAALAS